MKNIFKEALESIKKIDELITEGVIDTKIYDLNTFEYHPLIIDDLVNELEVCFKTSCLELN